MINKISIIIPVYNEIIYFEQSLKEIIELRLINNIKKEIIIICIFALETINIIYYNVYYYIFNISYLY
jgi:hypothetical protein